MAEGDKMLSISQYSPHSNTMCCLKDLFKKFRNQF